VNPSDFKSPEAGQVVRAERGYWALVPAPLPPELEYDSDLVLLLSNADSALSELSGLGRHLPNPHLLIAPLRAARGCLVEPDRRDTDKPVGALAE
jgi:hypothetical protein